MKTGIPPLLATVLTANTFVKILNRELKMKVFCTSMFTSPNCKFSTWKMQKSFFLRKATVMLLGLMPLIVGEFVQMLSKQHFSASKSSLLMQKCVQNRGPPNFLSPQQNN